MIRIGWLLCILYSSSALAAGEVEIPLLAETSHLQTAISRVLEFDENGKATLGQDPCNRIDLSDMKMATEDDKLSVDMAVAATTGVRVFGSCRGLTPWQGRLALKLMPQVTESGLAIEFILTSIELSRPDNSPGILSKPVQVIADALVLPRMKTVKIDLGGPLNELDGLIEQLLGPNSTQSVEQSLVQRTHISRLQTEETGLKAWIAFQVRASDPSHKYSEPVLDADEAAQWQTLEDEFDGFLTTIISVLAESTDSHVLRMELLAILLDARYAIAEALTTDNPESDPVRELFLTTWERLRPLMSELEGMDTPGLEVDYKLAAFIAGGDALRALDALGPEYGLEITRDGLRRLARLLLAGTAPPRFTPLPLEVDEDFRDLFGFDTGKKFAPTTIEVTQSLVETVSLLGSWLMPV
ncbi:lytic transglycosylase domain-containing protein, partial [Methylophaga sp. UBA1918]